MPESSLIVDGERQPGKGCLDAGSRVRHAPLEFVLRIARLGELCAQLGIVVRQAANNSQQTFNSLAKFLNFFVHGAMLGRDASRVKS